MNFLNCPHPDMSAVFDNTRNGEKAPNGGSLEFEIDKWLAKCENVELVGTLYKEKEQHETSPTCLPPLSPLLGPVGGGQ